MVVKKHIQCRQCRKYIDIYIEDKRSLKGMSVSCKCGNKQICIKDSAISKWSPIE